MLKQLVHDVNINKIASCCDICHFSKQKRLPFTASTHVSTNPFDLLHCDLWGPFATSTVDGFRFFLTIVDDFTRCTWVYLLKHKSETQVYLPQFATMVSTQFNCKIKTIRSDNGTEFYLKDFFQSNGILHQLSCVDTPQQNVVVERKHQHLLNVARALRFQSQFLLCFWGDCILTTIYLINRLPSKSLGNKSPYELLFKFEPSYNHLKCFGCLCFISTLPHNRDKFAPRARKCVFSGYPQGIKGYKVLDLTSNSIHISRNIIFYEHIFPYALSSQPSTSYLDDFIFPHFTSDSSQSVGINNLPSSISIDSNTMPIASSDAVPRAAPSTAPSVAHGEAPGAPHPASPNAASSAAPNSAEPNHFVLPLFGSISSPLPTVIPLPLSSASNPTLRRSIRPHKPPLTYLNMPASLSALSLNPICHMMFQLI